MSAKRLDVLLVDDDEDVLIATQALLERVHNVRAVGSFREALDELIRQVPDAIVCDLELAPYRGDALLAMVAREHPQVRRVLYTGSGLPDDPTLEGIAHRIVIKPGTFAELLASILGD
jgi:DNA-binding NtrC family response regulator